MGETSRRLGPRRIALSVLSGVLLIPLSALAAVALVPRHSDPVSSTGDTVASSTTSTTAGAEQVVLAPPAASATDLEAACGQEGMTLVDAEKKGTITDLQKAALDALRQVCEGAGTPLPGPPAPPPIVQTVKVAPRVSSSPSTVTSSTSSHHDDDQYEHEGGDD